MVDLVYRDGGTALLAAATQAGSTVVDGLEILVRQGALSLETWTRHRAPIEVMRAAARAQPFPTMSDHEVPHLRAVGSAEPAPAPAHAGRLGRGHARLAPLRPAPAS